MYYTIPVCCDLHNTISTYLDTSHDWSRYYSQMDFRKNFLHFQSSIQHLGSRHDHDAFLHVFFWRLYIKRKQLHFILTPCKTVCFSPLFFSFAISKFSCSRLLVRYSASIGLCCMHRNAFAMFKNKPAPTRT